MESASPALNSEEEGGGSTQRVGVAIPRDCEGESVLGLTGWWPRVKMGEMLAVFSRPRPLVPWESVSWSSASLGSSSSKMVGVAPDLLAPAEDIFLCLLVLLRGLVPISLSCGMV